MEKNNTPVGLLADAYAKMAAAALELESAKIKAEKDAKEWYTIYQKRDAQLKEAEAKLAEEIIQHEKTKQMLREALDKLGINAITEGGTADA